MVHCLDVYNMSVPVFLSVFYPQVASLLNAGVRSKEVFAMIVNQIMNSMPEIILQIVIATVSSWHSSYNCSIASTQCVAVALPP